MSQAQQSIDKPLDISGEIQPDHSSIHNSDLLDDSSDEEKQVPLYSTPEHIIVGWDDGDNDPLNPRSFPALRKWWYVAVVSISSMLM